MSLSFSQCCTACVSVLRLTVTTRGTARGSTARRLGVGGRRCRPSRSPTCTPRPRLPEVLMPLPMRPCNRAYTHPPTLTHTHFQSAPCVPHGGGLAPTARRRAAVYTNTRTTPGLLDVLVESDGASSRLVRGCGWCAGVLSSLPSLAVPGLCHRLLVELTHPGQRKHAPVCVLGRACRRLLCLDRLWSACGVGAEQPSACAAELTHRCMLSCPGCSRHPGVSACPLAGTACPPVRHSCNMRAASPRVHCASRNATSNLIPCHALFITGPDACCSRCCGVLHAG